MDGHPWRTQDASPFALALRADAYEPFPDDQPRGPEPFELLGMAEGVPTLVPSGVCALTLEPSRVK
jgi:hypothetical protein